MIPALSIMIFCYTSIRLLEMMAQDKCPGWLKFFAVVGIFINLVALIDIVNAGSRASAAALLGG